MDSETRRDLRAALIMLVLIAIGLTTNVALG